MERPHRPPPLTLTPPRSLHSSASRTTISAKARSPMATTISVFEPPEADDDDDDWNTGRWVTALRVLCDFGHLLVCMMLVLVMAFFLGNEGTVVSSSTGSSAIVLIVLVSLDILLDFQSIGRYDKKWRGWALAARILLGVAYASVFVAYVAAGGAFPEGYAFWGLARGYTTPVVYVILWTLGVWNFVYCAISRVHFAKEVARYRAALFPPSGDEAASRPGAARGSDVEGGATVPRQTMPRR